MDILNRLRYRLPEVTQVSLCDASKSASAPDVSPSPWSFHAIQWPFVVNCQGHHRVEGFLVACNQPVQPRNTLPLTPSQCIWKVWTAFKHKLHVQSGSWPFYDLWRQASPYLQSLLQDTDTARGNLSTTRSASTSSLPAHNKHEHVAPPPPLLIFLIFSSCWSLSSSPILMISSYFFHESMNSSIINHSIARGQEEVARPGLKGQTYMWRRSCHGTSIQLTPKTWDFLSQSPGQSCWLTAQGTPMLFQKRCLTSVYIGHVDLSLKLS